VKKFLYVVVLLIFSCGYGSCSKKSHLLENWVEGNKRANFLVVQRDLEKINNRLQELQGVDNAPHHVQDSGSPRLEISKDLALMIRLSADILQSYSRNYCFTLRSLASIGCYAAWSGASLLEWTATYWCPVQDSKVKKKD
jgi:hypothetical protein